MARHGLYTSSIQAVEAGRRVLGRKVEGRTCEYLRSATARGVACRTWRFEAPSVVGTIMKERGDIGQERMRALALK